MVDIIREVNLENSISSVSATNTNLILFQMNNCICKIIKKDGEKGTGFFCKIKVNQKQDLLPVLATNNHILNLKNLKDKNCFTLVFNEDKEMREIVIDKKRKIYTNPNKEFDVTFIEILPKDNIKNFLEIDEAIIEKEKNIREITYKKQSIYLLHYPKSQEVEVSYGKILDINDHKIRHLCNTENGSSGHLFYL